MTVAVTPYEVRSLLVRKPHRTQRLWALNIAGAFCFWPKRKGCHSSYDEALHLAEDISNMVKLMAIPEARAADCSNLIRVVLTQEVKDKLIREDYQDKTHARR